MSAIDASALEKARLHIKWKHQFQFAGYYAAIEKGFYKEHGLDIEILEPDFATDSVTAVLVGQAEFGVGNSDLLLYKHRGAQLVVLGVIFSTITTFFHHTY